MMFTVRERVFTDVGKVFSAFRLHQVIFRFGSDGLLAGSCAHSFGGSGVPI